jgi:hypothetical protein
MTLFDELSKEDGLHKSTVEAWGQQLHLRSLNGDEMIDYAGAEEDPKNKRVNGVRLLVASIAQDSEDGPRIPLEEQSKYVELLLKKDFRTLQLITKLARELNGMQLGGVRAAQESVKND